MRIETLGDGVPEVAVVGAVHGDEPCGARAIDRFLDSDLEARIRKPVKFVVVNERALEAGERYLEADLNRVIPGDPEADEHERRLASELADEVEGCLTLGFHSTVSFAEPFGTLANLTPEKAAILRALPVEYAADFTGIEEGYSVSLPRFVNVEAGLQGTDQAAENAYDCLAAFLRATDVLSGDPDSTDTDLYRIVDRIEKASDTGYRVFAENFSRVPAGEPFAETAAGETLRSDREFWPVLLSADGHDRLLGYRTTLEGEIGAVAGVDSGD
jgi:predicted deacylase